MKMSEAKVNKIAGIAIAVVGIIFILAIIPTQVDQVNCDWYNSPRLFPYVVSALITLLGICLFINGLAMGKKVPEEKQETYETKKDHLKMALGVFGIMVAYAALLGVLGYIPCTLAMLIAMMRFCGQKSWIKTIAVAVVLTLAVYFGFSKLLYLRMP